MIEPRILRELLALFQREDIPVTVRTSIAQVLGETSYIPAKEALLAGLTHPDASMRSSCINALANDWELGEVGPALVEILLHDDFEFVRMAAASGLGAIRYKQALPALKEVILKDKYDMTLREAAYEGLLAILGKDQDVFPAESFDKKTTIDWDLVRRV